MRVLAIETSGSVGGVAIAEGQRLVGERSFTEGLRHGRELMPSIRDVFDEAGWKPDDVDLIAVSVGPGSFTGLRIGVTCAKSLAFALSKAVVAVPSLDVLAENAPTDVRFVAPILDARRESVYAALYRQGDAGRVRETDVLVDSPEKVCALLPEGALVFGDGAERYREIFQTKRVVFGEDELTAPRAPTVARLGLALHDRGETTDPVALVPVYLRRPEAEEKWEERQTQTS